MRTDLRVLITGATGAVGPDVVKAFHAAGYSVCTLSIDPPPLGDWCDEVQTFVGDVTDPSIVRSALEKVEAVIHLAALLHIMNPPPALQEEYERINVGGTSTVVRSAIRAGVKRVLFFSTIAVYGQSDGKILTEDTPPQPDTFYARSKREAEKIVLEAEGADGVQIGTVLRLGAVYGSRIKGNYQRLVQSLAKGRFIPVGNGSNRRTLVYGKDVARAAVLAMQHPNSAGRIYNVSDGKFPTLKEIISAMCEALGQRPPRFSLPAAPIRLGAGIVEDIARLLCYDSPITRVMIDKYTEDIAVSSKRIQRELGFVPSFDLKSGWGETVREMRESGVL